RPQHLPVRPADRPCPLRAAVPGPAGGPGDASPGGKDAAVEAVGGEHAAVRGDAHVGVVGHRSPRPDRQLAEVPGHDVSPVAVTGGPRWVGPTGTGTAASTSTASRTAGPCP